MYPVLHSEKSPPKYEKQVTCLFELISHCYGFTLTKTTMQPAMQDKTRQGSVDMI
jgi:hypothetical protein